MANNAKAYELIYAAEPAGSPLRMACRHCGAGCGQKCRSTGHVMLNDFHRTRRNDLHKLRNAEAKMAQMNRDYGKV